MLTTNQSNVLDLFSIHVRCMEILYTKEPSFFLGGGGGILFSSHFLYLEMFTYHETWLYFFVRIDFYYIDI